MATVLGRTNRIDLPLNDKHRAIVGAIRNDQWALEDINTLVNNHKSAIEDLLSKSSLRDEPQTSEVARWMVARYQQSWYSTYDKNNDKNN
jgi:hypothetical protein